MFRKGRLLAFLLLLSGVPMAEALAQAMLGTKNCKPASAGAFAEVVAERDSTLDRSVETDFISAFDQ